MENKKRILHECPMCNGTLQVRELYCPRCRIRIQGDFEPPHSRLLSLSRKDLEFIELFVRLRGNIKEVEKALGISYPTVRGMLDSVIKSLGYKVGKPVDTEKRMEIIEKVSRGELSAEKAAQLLKGAPEEDDPRAEAAENKQGESKE
ncbi:MAG: DUF2089 domain-containing protein [Spirochaetaceae bacterium]|nr:MAG: DUF2089 domain-containing protein [Spirochaetaceae bacterium]